MIQNDDLTTFYQDVQSYWGRRRLGLVIDNTLTTGWTGVAAVSAWHSAWQKALRQYPDPNGLWLMGTPRLTPELVLRRHPSLPAPSAPPPARIGPYAHHGEALSEAAGDFTYKPDPVGPKPKDYRTHLRGRSAWFWAAIAVVTYSLPLVSFASAGYALVKAVPALIAATRIHGWQRRRDMAVLWLAVALAVVAIGLVIVKPGLGFPINLGGIL